MERHENEGRRDGGRGGGREVGEGGRRAVNGSNQVGEWSQAAEELKREKGKRRRK